MIYDGGLSDAEAKDSLLRLRVLESRPLLGLVAYVENKRLV